MKRRWHRCHLPTQLRPSSAPRETSPVNTGTDAPALPSRYGFCRVTFSARGSSAWIVDSHACLAAWLDARRCRHHPGANPGIVHLQLYQGRFVSGARLGIRARASDEEHGLVGDDHDRPALVGLAFAGQANRELAVAGRHRSDLGDPAQRRHERRIPAMLKRVLERGAIEVRRVAPDAELDGGGDGAGRCLDLDAGAEGLRAPLFPEVCATPVAADSTATPITTREGTGQTRKPPYFLQGTVWPEGPTPST